MKKIFPCLALFWSMLAWATWPADLEVEPNVFARSRLACRWCYVGFDHNIASLNTQRTLLGVDKTINWVQDLTLEMGAALKYRVVELDLTLMDHMIFGGDRFSIDSLTLGQANITLKPPIPVRARFGRQKLQLGHELVLGFDEWQSDRSYVDTSLGEVLFSPAITGYGFFANFLDRSTLVFMPVKDQLVWQDFLKSASSGQLNLDRGLMVVGVKVAPENTPHWVEAYWVIEYLSRDEFDNFKGSRDTHLDVVGVAYELWFGQRLEIGGELLYQWGQWGDENGPLSAVVYQRVGVRPLSSKHFQAYVSGWADLGGLPGFVFVSPDFHRHLGQIDLFGLHNLFASEVGVEYQFELDREHRIDVEMAAQLFWIHNSHNAIRAPDGRILMTPHGDDPSSFLGNEIDLRTRYTYDALAIELLSGLFMAGDYSKRHLWQGQGWDGSVAWLVALDVIVTL